MDIRQKPWGEEIVYIDEPEYAMKILRIKKGKHTSLHYHPIKKESFFLLEGKVNIGIFTGCCPSFCPLIKESTYTIPSRLKHQIFAVEDSIIIEISNQPKDDTIRVGKDETSNNKKD